MLPFDFQLRTRIVFGPDEVERLGALAAELGSQRALVVSDPGIVAAGHTARGLNALQRAGVATCLFDRVCENPSTKNVEEGLLIAQEFSPDLLVGFGGGSSMDCAKGINFLYTNGGRVQDYWGAGKAAKPMLPMIAVPTTAGTGSEMQSYALISDAETHVKMACGDKKATCRIAILDPTLTVTQPVAVTVLTGIDAIAHAVETYVTRVRNPISLCYSREAWRLLEENFSKVLDDPTDLNARACMQLGAAFAGVAIENSMLGAAHALANPLTSRYGIAHGQAVGLMLPHVVRFNGLEHGEWYRDLLASSSGTNGAPRPSSGAAGLAEFLSQLVSKAGLPGRLADCGVDQARLHELAEEASKQWTSGFNPRPATATDLFGLYQDAY